MICYWVYLVRIRWKGRDYHDQLPFSLSGWGEDMTMQDAASRATTDPTKEFWKWKSFRWSVEKPRPRYILVINLRKCTMNINEHQWTGFFIGKSKIITLVTRCWIFSWRKPPLDHDGSICHVVVSQFRTIWVQDTCVIEYKHLKHGTEPIHGLGHRWLIFKGTHVPS
jgi:hypothetical protein